MSIIDPDHDNAHLGLPFTHCDRLPGGACRPPGMSFVVRLSDDENWTSFIYTHGSSGNWIVDHASHPGLFEVLSNGYIKLPQSSERWDMIEVAYQIRWQAPAASKGQRTFIGSTDFTGAGAPPFQFLGPDPGNMSVWDQNYSAPDGSSDFWSRGQIGPVPLHDYKSNIDAGLRIALFSWPLGTTHTVLAANGSTWLAFQLWKSGPQV